MIFLVQILLVQAQFTLPLKKQSSASSFYRNMRSLADAQNEQNSLYLVDVLIGNPSKLFQLVIDTKKTTTWVENVNCNPCQVFKNQYDPAKSITSRTYKAESSGTFNKCESLGNLTSDFFTFTDKPYALSARYNFSSGSSNYGCQNFYGDGVLALGSYYLYSSYPLVMQMKAEGEISSAVFALYFSNHTDDNDGHSEPASSLEIGGFNLTKYSSNSSQLLYVPSQSSYYYWNVNFDSIALGIWGKQGGIQVTFDTSLDMIIGDINALFEIEEYLVLMGLTCTTSPQNFIVYCTTKNPSELPGLEVSYNNQTIYLENYYIWDCVKTNCTLQIEFSESGSWVFGNVFFRSVYTIFNYDNSSIGFSPAVKSKWIKTSGSLYTLAVSIETLDH